MDMSRDRNKIRYRCISKTCREEFDLAPRPVVPAGPGLGHRVTDGACPVCGSRAGRLNWYGLVTQTKAEAAVRDRLKAAGHRALYLHYLVPIRRTNRTTPARRHTQQAEVAKVRRPVLPAGYIFARMTTDDIAAARALPGVAGFCGTESAAQPIPEVEMAPLLSWGSEDGCVSLPDMSPGKRPILGMESIVRIKTGPFQGFQGPVVRDDGKLVRVEAEIFGRVTPVDLAFEDLEVIREAA